jgi:hypothetical protein
MEFESYEFHLPIARQAIDTAAIRHNLTREVGTEFLELKLALGAFALLPSADALGYLNAAATRLENGCIES